MTDLVGFHSRATIDAALERGVVAVPTDTVYGLAARLDRPELVASLFEMKRRPADHAVAVLIAGAEQLKDLVQDWNPAAQRLARALWPGALTIIVPVSAPYRGRLGGNGTTVGVRCPDHGDLTALIERVGPLAVTSANLHGQPPIHLAAAVVAERWEPALELVIDGGRCDGEVSTVVDVTGEVAQIVRHGAIDDDTVSALLAN